MLEIIDFILSILILILMLVDVYYVRKHRDIAEEAVEDMLERISMLESEVNALKGEVKEAVEETVDDATDESEKAAEVQK